MELTKEERDKFAAWCENEAFTNDGLAAQADKIGGMEPLVKDLRTKAIAATIIAKILRNIEDWEVK